MCDKDGDTSVNGIDTGYDRIVILNITGVQTDKCAEFATDCG